MWIFTRFGMFSVVEYRGNPKYVLVRGRVASDMDTFCLKAGIPNTRVVEMVDADYRYRVRIGRKRLARVLAEYVFDLAYTNFKNEVWEVQSRQRAHVYGMVWDHLRTELGKVDERERNNRGRSPGVDG